MRARVQYDIDYMRNWSLMFDLMIIAKCVFHSNLPTHSDANCPLIPI